MSLLSMFYHRTKQWDNKAINQSIDQSIDLSINQSILSICVLFYFIKLLLFAITHTSMPSLTHTCCHTLLNRCYAVIGQCSHFDWQLCRMLTPKHDLWDCGGLCGTTKTWMCLLWQLVTHSLKRKPLLGSAGETGWQGYFCLTDPMDSHFGSTSVPKWALMLVWVELSKN